MLQFEENTPPGSGHAAAGLQMTGAVPHTGALPSDPAAALAALAPAQMRRVNVADKRIINGQTDVNQLLPFKYK